MDYFIKNLLTTAESDLEATKLLYENGFYSKSAFFFQQSVEKTNKAFVLILENDSPEFLRKNIGHYTSKIHELHFKEQHKKVEGFRNLKSRFPKIDLLVSEDDQISFSESTKDFHDLLVDVRTRPDIYKEISEKDINYFLSQVNQIKDELDSEEELDVSLAEYESVLAEYFEKLGDVFGFNNDENFEKGIEELKQHSDVMLAVTKLAITIQQKTILPSVECMMLAIISTPHANIRYPSEDGEFNPDTFYTKNLPFIKKLPELIEWQEDCIKQVFLFNDSLSEFKQALNP